MLYTIFIGGVVLVSCSKDDYPSRDRSKIVPPPEVDEPEEPVDPSLVVFDHVDAADGWETVGAPIIETSGAKEGTGYLKNTIANGADFMQFIKKAATPVDSKLTVENGQFSFWWYIADVSLLKKDGQIEITSGGDADKHEFGWSVAKLLEDGTLKNGWNQLNLNFRDADIAGGDPDPAAFNFFRVFFMTESKDHPDLVSGVDGLVFREVPPAPAE